MIFANSAILSKIVFLLGARCRENPIAEVATDYSDRPLEDQVMETVVVETFGEEYPEPETV